MMSPTIYGPLKVEEFFQNYNWFGVKLTPELTETSGETTQESQWLCLTVEEFLKRHNWQGLAGWQAKSQSAIEALSAPLTMSVAQFFQFAAWGGIPTRIVTPPVSSKSQQVAQTPETLKLNDLPDLF